MNEKLIKDSLRKLGDFSLQFIKSQGGMPDIWMLYNPHVEGDAIVEKFDTFEELIEWLSQKGE